MKPSGSNSSTGARSKCLSIGTVGSFGTPRESANWRLIGDGEGFHWPDLDEDVSVENLLAGRHSGESLASFKHRMEAQKATLRSVRQGSSQRPRRRLERRNEVKHDD